jgi:hypothetical protein
VLEQNGLRPVAEILENCGIDCETDLSVLDQNDFSKLASRGLKPLHVKELERWCEAVGERAENMLPNTLAAALLSSEALNVVTPAAHSVGVEESECESGAENESERDGEEDDDDSDDDLQIVASSAGTEAPAKKAKMTLTEEQERFAKQFLPAASKVVRTRKISVRHVMQGFLHQKARSKTA